MITWMMEMIRHRLGWCPNARTIRTAPAVPVPPADTVNSAEPGGGAGGSGRIDRGAKLAAGSIRILIRNKRLLWFSLLSGIVMVFSLATTLSLQVISGTNPFPGTMLFTEPGTIILATGSFEWVLLTFSIALISTFLTVGLLAGLIACVSGIITGNTIPLREGLSRAGNHILPLAGWAVTGALAGTALSFITYAQAASLPVLLIANLAIFIFFILTIFVVPAIVLGGEKLVPAIGRSFLIFRKAWGELIVCAGIFFLICFGILLVSLIPITILGFSSGSPTMVSAALLLYMLVMMVILFIGSTLVGIVTTGLYTYGTTDRLPAAFMGS